MECRACPSPNFDPRPAGYPVDILLLHYTGMETAAAALARLCDPQARVSAHYTVDEDGMIFGHVPEEHRAWHAGISFWAGATDINGRSIGIEIVNPGHEFGYRAFPEPQIEAVIELAKGIVLRHGIRPERVLGHSDVAPARKTDPGELFPWARLAAAGIGLWRAPHSGPPVRPREKGSWLPNDAEKTFAAGLRQFGYGIRPDAEVSLEQALIAFQRHFRPSCIDGVADNECQAILNALLVALDDRG